MTPAAAASGAPGRPRGARRRRWAPWLLLGCAGAVACSGGETAPPGPPPDQRSDVEILRDRLKANPGDVEAWFRLAEQYQRAKLYQDQIDALQHVVAIDPTRGYAHLELGAACNRLERWQEAVDHLTRAAKYLPRQAPVYNNLAFSYGKLGRARDEIAALEKAIALRPRYAVARYNLGLALLRRGDRAGATRQLRALQEFDEGAAASLKKEIEAPGGRP